MRTKYEMPEEMCRRFLDFAEKAVLKTSIYPLRFIKKMKQNTGNISLIHPDGMTEDGLERKNPVIVALGDSVTAGHFEFIKREEPFDFEYIVKSGEPIDITDARHTYHEKFRMSLIDTFEQTSVSVINAGIAGDTIIGMNKRLKRDVLCYQPDLVLINGSLNWPVDCGPVDNFEKELKAVVRRIKENTDADIILMTPNWESPNPYFGGGASTLPQRVEVIRKIATEEGVCLSDAFDVWKEFVEEGHDPAVMLANHINHPTITGHAVYARLLMRLIEAGLQQCI